MRIQEKKIKVKNFKIGSVSVGLGDSLFFIAGPCVIESEKSTLDHAYRLKQMASRSKVPFIFKSSFDKANRTSLRSYRGIGFQKGLAILLKVKKELDVPVVSDVHSIEQVKEASGILDCLQIPAFLCRQTDLLVAAARTRKPINIKKGQFLAPWDMRAVIEKIEKSGNKKIILTERGTSFGYNNLVVDFRSLHIMRTLGYPVIFDATHSVQLPGGKGTSSGGERQYVMALSRAAVAFGCDGLFLEVHKNPDKALCDGPNMISLGQFEDLLKEIKQLHQVVNK